MAKYNGEYQRNRKTLLASDTTCWICGRDGADTADHVVPLMSGGTHDLDNLRPAHQRCNSIRGSHDQRRNALSRTNAPQRFFNATTDDPCPPFSIFGETSPDQLEPAGISPDQPGIGRALPRLETAGVGENGNGLAVARWAEAHMGVTLMAWQVRALCGQLSVRDDGRLRFRESLVSTARQNGKSVALCALIGWWLTERAARHGPQNVLSVANRLDRAEAIFATLAPVLVEKFGAKARHQLGQKSVTMVDGSQWEVRAASKRLHGGSNDLIVLDELFDIKPEVLDEALRPSQIARREPLLSAWSTAGDEESAAMIAMREAAIAAIDAGTDTGVYFAEWSIPPGADWRDESFWGWSNPSLGTTITLEALRAASGKDSFKRAHLNLWVAARGAWLEPGVWDKLRADDIPAGGVLSVDISSDGNRYAGVRAVTVAGITYTKLEFSVTSENEMWAEVARVTADPKTVLTVGPGLDAHLPKVLERRTMIAGAKEVSRYTGLVRGMIVAGQIRHDGSTALAEHINRAVAITVNGNLVLAANRSPGPIELCRLLVIASAVASKPQTSTKPILVVAG